MTDEELQAIKVRCDGFRTMNVEPYRGAYEMMGLRQAVDDNEALTTEVERLQVIERQQSEWITQLMDEQPRYAGANARLTTENAAMREIVEAVATEDTCAYESDAGDDVRCVFCAGEDDWREARVRGVMHFMRHTPNCIVTKARALLASESSDTPHEE